MSISATVSAGGQLVAQLDDEEYQPADDSGEADLQVAKANLDEDPEFYGGRRRGSWNGQTAPRPRDFRRFGAGCGQGNLYLPGSPYKVAQAQVANREAAYNAAQLRLSYTRIRATWEGGGGLTCCG